MASKNRLVVVLLATLIVISVFVSAQEQNSATTPALPRINTIPAQELDWSKDATEAETTRLIQQAAEVLEYGAAVEVKPAVKPNVEPITDVSLVVEQASVRSVATVQNTVSPALDVAIKPIAGASPGISTPVVNQPEEQYESQTASSTPIYIVLLYWLPGVLALVVTVCMLVYARSQMKKADRAGRKASILIAEIESLQKDIKRWELENHYNHISEMSIHIDAVQESVATAKEVRSDIEETINKGIDLNQKSIEILRKANKELSKSLVNQVSQLEQQLKDTVVQELEKIEQATSEKIQMLDQQKKQIIAEVKKSSELVDSSIRPGNITSQTSGSAVSQSSTMSLIDIINTELNSMKNKPDVVTTSSSHSAVAMSHADMLRESIALQKAAFSGNSTMAAKPVDSPVSANKTSSLKETTAAGRTVTNASVADEKAETVAEIKAQIREIVSNQKEDLVDSSAGSGSKYYGLDNKALMDKLASAEKWRNFKLAAELCAELASRGPEKSELNDLWGQMLARQAGLETGQGAIDLLRQASQKMQKAASLDASSYKVFNNWGVILKNLALTCTDNSETEKTLSLARRKFETSLSLNPKNHEALNNWGNTLLIQARYRTGTLHESLLQSACDKFAQAVSLKADKDTALFGWGNALFKLASCKTNIDARNKLLYQAQEKWLAANQVKPGIASKELRVLRSMIPDLGNAKTATGKIVTDYKFKTLSK